LLICWLRHLNLEEYRFLQDLVFPTDEDVRCKILIIMIMISIIIMIKNINTFFINIILAHKYLL